MQLLTKTITFTHGTAVSLNPNSQFGVRLLSAKVVIEPDAANTHVSYVGDGTMALGTSATNGVARVLAIPVAGAALDTWDVDASNKTGNAVDMGQIFVDGTTGEKARVTYWIN